MLDISLKCCMRTYCSGIYILGGISADSSALIHKYANLFLHNDFS